MKQKQLLLVGGGVAIVLILFLLGKTTSSVKPKDLSIAETQPNSNVSIDYLKEAKANLSADQASHILQLEESVTRGAVKEQQIASNKQLSQYWGDSLHNHEIALYYLGEVAKLENSEKSLTFAAQLLLTEVLKNEGNPGKQNWLGMQAKELFEHALKLDPVNDSTKIGLGACYMLANVSDSPMEGINMIREIVQKSPDNLYAHMMLGLGGLRSGQFDKAIEHFKKVAEKDPSNLEAVFNLAETYDRMDDKTNATKWYRQVQSMIDNPEIKKEIENRINNLK